MIDRALSLALAAATVVAGVAYGGRVLRAGRARHERVESDRGSALLGKRAMEVAYWVLDPLANRLAAARIGANAVTTASLALGVAAGVALALGHFGVGAALAALSGLSDAMDGLVARRAGTASDAGEVFDAAVDRYTEAFFLGGVAVFFRQSLPALILTLAALLGAFMVSYSTAKAEALRVEVPRGSMRRAERAVYLVLGAALVPLAPASLAPLPILLSVALIALVANASAALRLRATARAAGRRPPVPCSPGPSSAPRLFVRLR